jgi:hypothetical protein
VSATDPLNRPDLSVRATYSRTVSDGDWAYDYRPDGLSGPADSYSGRRANNAFRRTNVFATGSWRPSSRAAFRLSFQSYRAAAGLPGPVSRPTATARSNDGRTLVNATFETDSRTIGQFETTVAFSESRQRFVDTLVPQDANRFHGVFLNDALTVRETYDRTLPVGADLRVTGEYRQDGLFHDDWFSPNLSMGRSARRYLGAGVGLSQSLDISALAFADELSWKGAMRWDQAETDKDSTSILDSGRDHVTRSVSPALGIALRKGAKNFAVVRTSYGKSVRLPELNALFWKGDARSAGNPNLRPERSEHSEATLELHSEFAGINATVSGSYYHSRISDLILWQVNFRGVWQPVNVGATLITGHEETVEVNLFDDAVSFVYQNAVTNARNKSSDVSSHGQRLPFYPRFMTSYKIAVNFGDVRASAALKEGDRTYTNYANTKWFDSFRVVDLSVAYALRLSNRWRLEASAGVDNVTDEDYVLLAGYPMPGRSVSIHLGCTFTTGGSR